MYETFYDGLAHAFPRAILITRLCFVFLPPPSIAVVKKDDAASTRTFIVSRVVENATKFGTKLPRPVLGDALQTFQQL